MNIEMPLYEYRENTIRENGRVVCYVSGLKQPKQYRSRLVYCNYYECTLEDIEGFHVHHIDEDPSNDYPDNLELLTPYEHSQHHPDQARGQRSLEICDKFSRLQKTLWDSGFYANRKPRRKSGSYKYDASHATEVEKMKDSDATWDHISGTLNIARTTARRLYAKRKRGII